jgi:sporulation protein YlmC with PRC-barrel domain
MKALQTGAYVLLATISATTFMQSKVTGETKDNTVFIAEQAPEYWRASKLIGVGVFNLQAEKIGSVSEVLLDHDGVAKVVVIDAGGVFGIVRKTVGVPFDTLKWVSHEDAVPNTFNAPNDKRSILPLPVQPKKKPRADAISGYPDHAIANLTKAQLKDAVNFRYLRTRSSVGPAAPLNTPGGPAAPP